MDQTSSEPVKLLEFFKGMSIGHSKSRNKVLEKLKLRPYILRYLTPSRLRLTNVGVSIIAANVPDTTKVILSSEAPPMTP